MFYPGMLRPVGLDQRDEKGQTLRDNPLVGWNLRPHQLIGTLSYLWLGPGVEAELRQHHGQTLLVDATTGVVLAAVAVTGKIPGQLPQDVEHQ